MLSLGFPGFGLGFAGHTGRRVRLAAENTQPWRKPCHLATPDPENLQTRNPRNPKRRVNDSLAAFEELAKLSSGP